MNSLKISFFLLLLLSTNLTGQEQFIYLESPEKVGFDQARLNKLDGFIQGLVDDEIIPNAVTFIARKGQVVHHKAFGHHTIASGQALKKDDIFRIASQTKAMVSVGLMMLFEEGHFLLEEPISKYIPAFEKMRVLSEYDEETGEYTTKPATKAITIRHLLSHTAGIPYGLPIPEKEEWKVPFFASLEAETTEEVVNRIAQRPLLHEPGDGFTYGLNTDVIGRLVEILSGEPLDVYMQDRVFGPLGMDDSYFYLPAAKHKRLVSLYSKHTVEESLTLHKNETYRDFAIKGAQTYYSAGAGSVGTIENYARFCQMMLNGGTFNGQRLLSPHTVQLMWKSQSNGHDVWNRKDDYGLGFQRIGPDSEYGDQAPTGSYTWGGMYLSEYTIDPVNELVLLIYTNLHPTPHYGEVVRKFRVMVYAALVGKG